MDIYFPFTLRQPTINLLSGVLSNPQTTERDFPFSVFQKGVDSIRNEKTLKHLFSISQMPL